MFLLLLYSRQFLVIAFSSIKKGVILMKIKKVLISAAMFISLTSFAENRNVVKISYSAFPPFEFVENGKMKGLDVEIVTEVMKRIGYEVEFEGYPWNRAMTMTENGELDAIMSLRKSPEREEKFLFAAPIALTQNYFFKRKKLEVKETKISELTKYSIGTIGGYVYDKDFVQANFPRLEVMNVDNPEFANLKKLATDRLDLAACEINVCKYLINTNKEFADLDYVKNIPIGKVENFYIAFSKKDPEKSNKIIKMFNSELSKFIAEGKRAELIKKYNLVNLE